MIIERCPELIHKMQLASGASSAASGSLHQAPIKTPPPQPPQFFTPANMSTATAPAPGASRPTPLLQPQPSTQRLPTQSSSQQQQSQSGLRTPSNRKTIYDRNLNRTRTSELSRASFGYLFAEMVSYAQRKVTGIQDLERRYD